MWISWSTAALWALGMAALAVGCRRSATPRLAGVAAAAHELAVVLSLYSVWRWVHHLTVRQVTGADRHARWLWSLQQWLHLPSELDVQALVLPHPLVVQALNGYYAIAHGPATIAALVWLFVRDRRRYPVVRNAIALLTGACLVIRLYPVAPPRLLPDLGFVDTGLLYDQSVYGTGTGGLSNQLAAMPSIHVAWALLVAYAVVTAGRTRWRWLVLLHPVLTVLSVTATANHWWADGIVAAALLWAALAVARRTTRPPRPTAPAVADTDAPAPVAVPA